MRKKTLRPFRYEASWSKDAECSKQVEKFWGSTIGNTDYVSKVQHLLAQCRRGLKSWSIARKQDYSFAITSKLARLKELQNQEAPTNMEEIKSLQKELNILLEQEDIRWKQRAKQAWYKNGDRNTKFFHACANQCRKKNYIKSISSVHNHLLEREKDIETAFKSYFENFFTSTRLSIEEINSCMGGLETRVTDPMNSRLNRDYTRNEVEEVLK